MQRKPISRNSVSCSGFTGPLRNVPIFQTRKFAVNHTNLGSCSAAFIPLDGDQAPRICISRIAIMGVGPLLQAIEA